MIKVVSSLSTCMLPVILKILSSTSVIQYIQQAA